MKVWKGSKSLGIGMAKSGDGFVVVCKYFKAGNAMGEFDSNVSPSVEINKKRVINKNLRKLYLNWTKFYSLYKVFLTVSV